MRLTSLLCTSLLLLVASCGGSDGGATAALNSGYTSLNAGNHQDALGHFETALAILKFADDDFLGAKLGQLQALANLDADKTKTTLMAVPKEAGIEAKDYRSIVTELSKSANALATDGEMDKATKSITVAIAILTEGKGTYPEYEGWDKLIQQTGAQAETLGDPAALEALKGLGYTGD